MRVVVTGASGNVGTSVLDILADADPVEDVGLRREAGGLRADHQLAPDVAVPAGVPLHHFTQSRFIGACSFNGDDTARVNAPRVGPRCVEGVFDTHDGSLAHWNALRREPHHVQPTILLCVAGS